MSGEFFPKSGILTLFLSYLTIFSLAIVLATISLGRALFSAWNILRWSGFEPATLSKIRDAFTAGPFCYE